MPEQFFSIEKFKKFLEFAVQHYQQSAPRLAEWLDEMYIQLGEPEWKTITLEEIQQIQYLHADDCWLAAEWALQASLRMHLKPAISLSERMKAIQRLSTCTRWISDCRRSVLLNGSGGMMMVRGRGSTKIAVSL